MWSLTNSRKQSVLKTTSRNWKKFECTKKWVSQYLISAWGYQLEVTIGFTCITHLNQTVSGQRALWVMHELCFNNAVERIGVQVWSIFTSNAMTVCLIKIKTLRLPYASLENKVCTKLPKHILVPGGCAWFLNINPRCDHCKQNKACCNAGVKSFLVKREKK